MSAWRHTAATLLMRQNVKAKIVASKLGHSQTSATVDLLQPRHADDAARGGGDARRVAEGVAVS